uniref:Uncharacterized protein n=1 Tax=Amphimedon queenslandica TaxID=400682 RepID=A0A1X7VLQ6_AMPQE
MFLIYLLLVIETQMNSNTFYFLSRLNRFVCFTHNGTTACTIVSTLYICTMIVPLYLSLSFNWVHSMV